MFGNAYKSYFTVSVSAFFFNEKKATNKGKSHTAAKKKKRVLNF